MNELQTVNDIIAKAVEHSSYATVIISSVVFILYTLIVKAVDYFKAKDRAKPMLEMANAIKTISENVATLNKVLDKTFKDAEVKEISRVNNIIEVGFKAFQSDVLQKVSDIVLQNNVKNKPASVKENIYKIVSTEYYKLYSILSAYELKGINVASKLKEDWIDSLVKDITNIVFEDETDVNRIKQLGNKLEITIDDYSVHVNNKIFNH